MRTPRFVLRLFRRILFAESITLVPLPVFLRSRNMTLLFLARKVLRTMHLSVPVLPPTTLRQTRLVKKISRIHHLRATRRCQSQSRCQSEGSRGRWARLVWMGEGEVMLGADRRVATDLLVDRIPCYKKCIFMERIALLIQINIYFDSDCTTKNFRDIG